MSRLIGITATVPVEVVYAAGLRPVDLNNLFITSAHARALISSAESAGFSHNICSWIKGIYSTVVEQGIHEVIAVTGGDCSNTVALGEVLERKGVRVTPFQYPLNRTKETLFAQIDALRKDLSATWTRIKEEKKKLDRIRDKLRRLDRYTYRDNLVTGLENHLFLVSSSDFEGDPMGFEGRLDQFFREIYKRDPMREEIRLGYLGVPPVFSRFYEFIESLGARVVFNEVQRQFSMPFECGDMVEQYLQYTYPYDFSMRLDDIEAAVRERHIHGLIHYTQTFCYRQIYDILLRESLSTPILTLEGDRPGPIDGRTALRIETFVEMLRQRTGFSPFFR